MQKIQGKYCKDCIIYNDSVEESAMCTIQRILDSEAFDGAKVRIMPDCHDGKGIVIGFTVPLGKYVCPSHVGVDIGCTVDMMFYKGTLQQSDYETVDYRIRKEIPFGFDVNQKKVFDEKEFFSFLNNYYSKARSAWPDMVYGIGRIDDIYIDDMLSRIGMDSGLFYKSVGSVGGGNHYIEIGVTESGDNTVSVHCGSRNFGVRVCKYWERVANGSKIDKRLLKEKVKELKRTCEDKTKLPEMIESLKAELSAGAIDGYLSGEDMRGYISDMVVATAYALFNHKVIHDRIAAILGKFGLKQDRYISTTHNYIDFSDHILRKGAIRAYKGEEMLLPFNMRDGVAVCEGKSDADWNCSCPHGSGRRMSRAKARERIPMSRFKEQMEGIYSTSVVKTVLDESPDAYKDTEEIKGLISETCEIKYIVKPVINLKDNGGTEDND